MKIIILFVLFNNTYSLMNGFPKINKSKYPYKTSFLNDYNQFGLTDDDALYRWTKGDYSELKKEGIKISAQKLTDHYENSLYSVFLKFNNNEIEDRVVHFYQSRGATTRFYTILGKNSNGLNLAEYNKYLLTSIGKSFATAVSEVALAGFLLSGGFNDFVHQLNSDGTLKEVIATTGVISFLSSKAIEALAGHGAKGLNPAYHLKTYLLLSPAKGSIINSKYTDESIMSILHDRLDEAYFGYLKQGGMNPELTVSFTMRSKSDQNWIRELKKAICAIYQKRFELLVKPEDKSINSDSNLSEKNENVNLTIENIVINIENSDDFDIVSDLIRNEKKLSQFKLILTSELNSRLDDDTKKLEDSLISDAINKVILEIIKIE